MVWSFTVACRRSSLVFIEDVTADRISKIISEMYFAHIQPSDTRLKEWRFIVQMDHEHTVKELNSVQIFGNFS